MITITTKTHKIWIDSIKKFKTSQPLFKRYSCWTELFSKSIKTIKPQIFTQIAGILQRNVLWFLYINRDPMVSSEYILGFVLHDVHKMCQLYVLIIKETVFWSWEGTKQHAYCKNYFVSKGGTHNVILSQQSNLILPNYPSRHLLSLKPINKLKISGCNALFMW